MTHKSPIEDVNQTFQLNFAYDLYEMTKKNLIAGNDNIVLQFVDGRPINNSISPMLLVARYPNSEFGKLQNSKIADIIRQEVWKLGFTIDIEYKKVTDWKFINKFPFIELVHYQRPEKAIIHFN